MTAKHLLNSTDSGRWCWRIFENCLPDLPSIGNPQTHQSHGVNRSNLGIVTCDHAISFAAIAENRSTHSMRIPDALAEVEPV